MNPRESAYEDAWTTEEKNAKGLPHHGGSPFREWSVTNYALTICGINVP